MFALSDCSLAYEDILFVTDVVNWRHISILSSEVWSIMEKLSVKFQNMYISQRAFSLDQ